MFAAVYFGILSKVHVWSLSSRRSFKRAILSELANSQPCIDKQSILLQTLHCKGWRDEINESIKNIKSDSLVIRYFTNKKKQAIGVKKCFVFTMFLTVFNCFSLFTAQVRYRYHWHRVVRLRSIIDTAQWTLLSQTLQCHWYPWVGLCGVIETVEFYSIWHPESEQFFDLSSCSYLKR